MVNQVATGQPFVIGSMAPKRRNHNSSFNREPPVYSHELERTDPMMDLYEQWSKRMPE
jgi:hypothetical protein